MAKPGKKRENSAPEIDIILEPHPEPPQRLKICPFNDIVPFPHLETLSPIAGSKFFLESITRERFILAIPRHYLSQEEGVGTLTQIEPVNVSKGQTYLLFHFLYRIRFSAVKTIVSKNPPGEVSEGAWEKLDDIPPAQKEWEGPEFQTRIQTITAEFLKFCRATIRLTQSGGTPLSQHPLYGGQFLEAKNSITQDLRNASSDTIGMLVDSCASFLHNTLRILCNASPPPEFISDIEEIYGTIQTVERLEKLCPVIQYLAAELETICVESEYDRLGYTNNAMDAQHLALPGRYERIKPRLPKDVQKEFEKEFSQIQPGTHPFDMAAAKDHLEWLFKLFELEETRDNTDIPSARQVLDEDHWGLEKVKSRILEYLSLHKRNPQGSGDILCFVGPPGIGKTSLGQSIARALGRNFIRLSLGGLRDEGEIRGHGLVYMRTQPGQIIKHIIRSGSKNPVFMLDEVDKIPSDWRGDPAAALLSVLDPEQNKEFLDSNINVPYDSSRVFFICTANTTDTIPRALEDRFDVIRLPGYTSSEKLMIAKNHLLKKQRARQGVPIKRVGKSPLEVSFTDGAIKRLIEEYTTGAGVRNLEREIRSIFRKVGLDVDEGKFQEIDELQITAQNLHLHAGKPRIYPDQRFDYMPPGCVPMFAVSELGGRFFYMEMKMQRGRDHRKIKVTGVRGSGEARERINNLIEESIDVALDSLILEGGILYETPEERKTQGEFYIHVHVRGDGAAPKDGPSAGIPAIAGLYGLLKNKSIQPHTGATGEIDLSLGFTGPIGGLKEKALAAQKAGIKKIIIPKENEVDLEDIPLEIKSQIEFIPRRLIWEALLDFFPGDETLIEYLTKREKSSS